MKKSLLLILVLVLSLSLLVACGPEEDPTPTPTPDTECTEHVMQMCIRKSTDEKRIRKG